MFAAQPQSAPICCFCLLSKGTLTMNIEELTSPPMSDGVSVLPGEHVTYDGVLLTYLGTSATFLSMMVLRKDSGERILAHPSKCRL